MSEPKDKHGAKPAQSGPNLASFLRSEQPPRRTDASLDARVPSDPPPPGDPEAAITHDLEKALVERIADVDDDRRRSANQMRKALETHRDEVRTMRQRDRAILLLLAGLGILLIAALALMYSELVKTRDALDGRLTALEERTTRLGPPVIAPSAATPPAQSSETDGAPTRAELDELADAIEAIGDRLAAAEGRTRQLRDAADTDRAAAEAAPADGPSDAVIKEQIRAAESRLEQLLDERLIRVKERLDQIQAATGSQGDANGGTEPAQPGPVRLKKTGAGVQTEQPTVVVQLAGFRDRADIDTFIRNHDLQGPLYLRTESWRGRPWYALVQSLHSSMAQAEAASAALPPNLARLDTWLRPLPAGARFDVIDAGG
jgi:DamX protein